jgi:DNA polymerase III subunit epsilon
MREVVLDTETTGLDPGAGHRLVEVAGLELVNHVPTGRHIQQYVNPERPMPEEAYRIHGLSAEFLAGFPVFPEVAQDLLDFIGDSRLVIHNADFDLKFLNAELARAGHGGLSPERATDTVALARRRFPGAQVSLDALCRRFEIDNTTRTLHGALLDCELLAEVYLELRGGRQPGLDLAANAETAGRPATGRRPVRPVRPHAPGADERAAHDAFIDGMKSPIWRR